MLSTTKGNEGGSAPDAGGGFLSLSRPLVYTLLLTAVVAIRLPCLATQPFYVDVPYSLVLARHFPHAGYLCFLSPVLCIFPLIFASTRLTQLKMAGIFAIVALAQIFVLRQVAPTSIARCVVDSYFLQYSREGIKTETFNTLASLALNNGIWVDKIPAVRIETIRLQEEAAKGQ